MIEVEGCEALLAKCSEILAVFFVNCCERGRETLV